MAGAVISPNVMAEGFRPVLRLGAACRPGGTDAHGGRLRRRRRSRWLATLVPVLGWGVALAAAAPVPQVKRADFPSFGVSVEPPGAGWGRALEHRPNVVAAWSHVRPGEPRQADGRFSIAYFDSVAETIDAVADRVARDTQGKVVASDVKVAGLATRKIVPEAVGEVNYYAYLCKRGSTDVFLVEYRSAGTAAYAGLFKRFAASIRLSTPQEPVRHLGVREYPLTAIGSTLIFEGIEPLRFVEEKNKQRQTTYQLRNWAAGRDDLLILITTRDKPQGGPLSQYLDPLAAGTARTCGHEVPTFSRVKAPAEVWLSPLMKVTAAATQPDQPEGARPAYYMHIVASAVPGELTHFACLIAVRDPEQARIYAQAVEKMAASIRRNPAAAPSQTTP